MDALKCLCPACNLIFEVHPAQTVVTCPVCDTPVGAGPQTVTSPPAVAPAAAPTAVAGRSRRGLIALAVLAFLAGGITLAVHGFSALSHPSPTPVAVHPAAADESPAVEPDLITLPPVQPPPVLQAPPAIPQPGPPSPAPPPQQDPVPELPRIVRGPDTLPTALPMRINRAIERGVVYLRRHMAQVTLPCRYEGLAGLALLECGVSPSDPVIQRIATSLRSQAKTLSHTYELSTSIFFFDRLGRAADVTHIHTFADRLLAGQTESGTWTYTCPLVGSRPWQHVNEPWKITDRNKLARQPFPRPLPPLPAPPLRRSTQRGDHSNTQFALTALWIAQRNGAAAHAALRQTGKHFRATQDANGSWGYVNPGQWTFSNTCAALLGLAVEHGIDQGVGRSARPNTLPYDRVVRAALLFLGRSMPAYFPGGGRRNFVHLDGRDMAYTLWSMERVGTVYGLKRIGNTEWYPWAAEVLVDTQEADGCWGSSPISTSFALLVLRRSNLVPDLTEAVTGRNPRRPDRPPLVTGKPNRPPESDVAQKPTALTPPEGVSARPDVPVPQGGITTKTGTREPMPDARGIAPREEVVPLPRAN